MSDLRARVAGVYHAMTTLGPTNPDHNRRIIYCGLDREVAILNPRYLEWTPQMERECDALLKALREMADADAP